MDFEAYRKAIRNAEAKGDIKASTPLSDFDLAVQFVLGQIGDKKGYPCNVTAEEIWHAMLDAGLAKFFDDCTEYAETLREEKSDETD